MLQYSMRSVMRGLVQRRSLGLFEYVDADALTKPTAPTTIGARSRPFGDFFIVGTTGVPLDGVYCGLSRRPSPRLRPCRFLGFRR